ncbi:MAG: hypothetical protein IH988_11710 [Planctomycetes bacterium]|nr:hypothetical protein [Planctomycetota bacterium]
MANTQVRLTQATIVAWADRHYEHTGRWPTRTSGAVEGVSYWTWKRIDRALYCGDDGLPGGISLAWLLYEHWGVLGHMETPPLTEAYIVELAIQHHRRTGRWPRTASGSVHEAPDETWNRIEQALQKGHRSLPGGSSLARLLQQRLNVRNVQEQPDLSERQILRWADHHFDELGEWPGPRSGPVATAPDEKWRNIDNALRYGMRGMPGGSSLAKLLATERGRRNLQGLTTLTESFILQWAAAHQRRTGDWPTRTSGSIPDSPNPEETWARVNSAMEQGHRGLPGRSSLARLLHERRGVRRKLNRTLLTEESIVKLAVQHRAATGSWPISSAGPVPGTSNDTWNRIDQALRKGHRGLEGGLSLAELLRLKRSVRNRGNQPKLTERQILKWADLQLDYCGRFPGPRSGPVLAAQGEDWRNIDNALRYGLRGMEGGTSLPKLLAGKRGRRNVQDLIPLTESLILRWATAHHKRAGKWPTVNSGIIPDAPDPQETWRRVESAMARGRRGLSGRSSIAKLLLKHRKKRHLHRQPRLNIKQILIWIDAHYWRTQECPQSHDGLIIGTHQEKWRNIDNGLRYGLRGLQGGSSIARLISKHRPRYL